MGIVLGSCGALAACMATGPEARRAAYLDCARDAGFTVQDGTIMVGPGDDFRSLDVCEALPR